VAELARDELVGGAGAHRANRVEVAGIVDAVMRESERRESCAVRVADVPAGEATKEPFTR
jgi:hypothetical protein